MNKPRLIKRGEAPPAKPVKPVAKAVTIQSTMQGVKEWIGARHASTKHNAREAFANLFAPPQEPCTEC
ncbi:MAG: hypothetical protein U0Y68_19600 [Blastocatellia bacterium]